jgi:periplasmic protein TonB
MCTVKGISIAFLSALPADADLSNVVPLRRGRIAAAPALAIGPQDRPAPLWAAPARRHSLVLFVAGSLALHAAFVFAFNREPVPVASLGEISISVEVVLGSDTAAGLAQARSESEAIDAAAAEPEAAPAENVTAELRAAPEEAPPPAEAEAKPAEIPAANKETERPRTDEKQKPAPKPVAPAKRGDGDARARSASLPSAAASGVGRGRSDADSNYRGLVAAHLARYKQFPADARGRGEQGSALVMFSLDGGGAVASVKLMRGSGVASIDAETQAMVRRASPFPAPPSGRPMTFTVPVRFHLQ